MCAEEGRLQVELAHMVRETGKSMVFRACQQAEDSGRVSAVLFKSRGLPGRETPSTPGNIGLSSP